LAPYLTYAGNARSATNLAPSQSELVEKVMHAWMHQGAEEPRAVVQLYGPDSISKLAIASRAALQGGLRLFRIAYESVPAQPAELDAFARLWQRENLLLPLALYVDAQEIESELHAAAIRRFLARCGGFVLLAVRETFPRLGRSSLSLEVSKPTMEEQKQAWDEVAGIEGSQIGTALAGQFSLNISDIRDIGEIAASEPTTQDKSFSATLWDVCRLQVRPHLDALAQRLDPRATWNDIVLPEEETEQLRQIAAQVNQRTKVYSEWGFGRRMNRGFGINALFAGESGTGKTMAAEVIANELRLNLYRVDLSSVVSKYIGETEKNLRRLFDAAEDGGAILFFDEADALFGKRSEVKDSHDRYSNIEVNYLLQRMETYCGLAILATNIRSALDVAFTRRLRFIVNFPFPNTADRRRMWRKAFPPQTPVVDLDFDRLARVNLTGGSVHNAAINAAFLAAQLGTAITMGIVLKAIRSELIKMDRAVIEADFRWIDTKDEVA
jgi:ATP-dependent 26S proteasome regulatory subunit